MSNRFAVTLRTLLTGTFLGGIALVPLPAHAQIAAEPAPAATGVQLLPPAAPPPVPEASAAPAVPETSPPSAGPAAAAAPGAGQAAGTPGTQVIVPPGREQVDVTANRISTGVVAIVNDYVISDYDLDQRVALFVATSGIRPTRETLAQMRTQVLRSLEDEVLELQEAQKHKINVSKTDVDRALQNIAEDNKLTIDQILGTIKEAGVTPETFRQQVAAQLTWQRLVAARYGTDIFVSDQQVDDAMNRLKEGSDKPQFLLSEIFVAVDRPEDEATVRASADQIVQQLKQGAPFGTVANQFSQSPSAADQGEVGWVVLGQLAEEIDSELMKLQPGDIAGPVRAEGGYYVFLLRDRREPVGTQVPEAATPVALEASTPVPLDRLLIPLPSRDKAIVDRGLQLGNDVAVQLRNCGDLQTAQRQMRGTVYTRLGTMKPSDLAADLRDALLKTEPGQVIPPFVSPAGVEIIMRCDPARPRVVVFQMPTREQLQQQMFQQQMAILAKSYLRDLRRDAVVETR